MTDVTDVLRDRMQTPAGLQRMLTVSVAVHLVLAAALLFTPNGLLRRQAGPAPIVMTISLSSAGDTPDNSGLTPMGGAPVQPVVPPDEPANATPFAHWRRFRR